MAEELTVEICLPEQYKDILKTKFSVYNQLSVDVKFKQSARQCIINQADYIDQELFTPLKLCFQDESNIVLHIHPEKFKNREHKEQFLKEIAFLRKLESAATEQEPFSLGYYAEQFNEGEGKTFLLPLFVQREEKTS